MQTSQTQITNFDETNLKYFHVLGDQQWAYNLNLFDLVGLKSSYYQQRIALIEQVYQVFMT